MNRGLGWLLALLVFGGVAVVIALNLNVAPTPSAGASKNASSTQDSTKAPTSPAPTTTQSAPFREVFIGEPIIREPESLEIAAVYFPAVPMEGMVMPSGDHALHIEADVRATEGNANGFALGQFVPYMKIQYSIAPASGGEPLAGELIPMVARDGLHYGATVVLPGPGSYRLTYSVSPPSSGGLGRHDDPVTGVGPWWKPFEVAWDWTYAP